MELTEDVEFAVRQYVVATEHLMDVLSRYDEIPSSIGAELIALSDAITMEWNEAEFTL